MAMTAFGLQRATSRSTSLPNDLVCASSGTQWGLFLPSVKLSSDRRTVLPTLPGLPPHRWQSYGDNPRPRVGGASLSNRWEGPSGCCCRS